MLLSVRSVPLIAIRYLCAVGLIVAGMTFGWLGNLVFFNESIRALDLWATLYAQLIACALLTLCLKTVAPEDVILPVLVAFPIIQVCLLVMSLVGLIGLPIWYSGEDEIVASVPFISRFMGWSVNPNQLGISLSALPFWLLLFYAATRRTLVRMAILTALGASILCGFLINSNTVFLAWMFGSLVLFYKLFWQNLHENSLRRSIVTVTLVAVLVFMTDRLPGLLEKGYDSDFNGRLPIWLASLEYWAASPLFGLGPGPHASDGSGGVTAESHMLLLDFLTQGGVVAAVGMIYLFWLSFRSALRSGHVLALAGTIALFIEALAHNTQRHPMFWVYLILPLLLTRLFQFRQVRNSLESAV